MIKNAFRWLTSPLGYSTVATAMLIVGTKCTVRSLIETQDQKVFEAQVKAFSGGWHAARRDLAPYIDRDHHKKIRGPFEI